MYQHMVSDNPTPVVLSTSGIYPAESAPSMVGAAFSVNGIGKLVSFCPTVSFDKNNPRAWFVQSADRGRSLFGAKFSCACPPDAYICPFWFVYESQSGKSSPESIAISSFKVFPFKSYTSGFGEDILTVDTSPSSSGKSVYVGVGFVGSSLVDIPFSVSISQYLNQEPFFQPLK